MQSICVVIGNELPVAVLVNLVDSEINGHTEHLLALHLVHPGWALFASGRSLAFTTRSRRLRGRRKARMGGDGKTFFR